MIALFFFLLSLQILAILTVSCCSLILTRFTESIEASLPLPKVAVLILLSISAASIFISFSGCCLSAKESPRFAFVYSCILVIFAIISLVVSGIILNFSLDFTSLLVKGMDHLQDTYNENSTMYDEIQQSLKCCGSRGMGSWGSRDFDQFYPLSCCPAPGPCFEDNIYKTSCVFKVSDLLEALVQLSFLLGFAMVVIFTTLFAATVYLARSQGTKPFFTIKPSKYYRTFTTV